MRYKNVYKAAVAITSWGIHTFSNELWRKKTGEHTIFFIIINLHFLSQLPK